MAAAGLASGPAGLGPVLTFKEGKEVYSTKATENFQLFCRAEYILYTADLLKLIERHNLHPHAYADDTHIYGFSSPPDATKLYMQMSACIDKVALWMQSNRQQLNTAKTEIPWCATIRRQHLILQTPTRICDDYVTSAASVRDLGST